MNHLSFHHSQAFSPLITPSNRSLTSTPLHHTSLVTSRLDCKPPNNITTTPSRDQLTPLNPTPNRLQLLPVQHPITRPRKEVKSWNPLQRLVAAALDMVEESLIASLEKQHPLPATADPEVQLAGNFFPVPESPVQHELEVEGKLPETLEGVYVRNGANPMFEPVGGHHLFDGDGMLHAVRLKQGIASYANRFTRTHRLREEERVGRAIFPKAVGELHGHSGVARLLLFYARSLFGLVDGSKGMGVANAGVVYFNGHLLAMSEDDLPYAVHIKSSGDLETVGRFDFNGQLRSAMIAHPKVDAESGELFALSYDVIKKPYLRYFRVSKDGEKSQEVSIHSVGEPTMMHDFAITQQYVVIPDQQVVFKLKEMLSGGSPVVHEHGKMPRFGILPRNAVDDRHMRWIDVPDCFCFHLWNAWEDGDEVVVIGSCMTPPDSIFNESKDSLRSILSEIRLNLTTLTSTRRAISPSINLEAGQVNRKLVGKKTKFAYLAIAEPWPKVSGVAKVNLLHAFHDPHPHVDDPHPHVDDPHPHLDDDNNNVPNVDNKPNHNNVVASFIYPPNCYGGEPMFVPRSLDPSTPEDDGYVLTFMHNDQTGKSELLVLDASSSSLDMVASIKLPSRVPYGFHGTFITAQELKHQKPTIF